MSQQFKDDLKAAWQAALPVFVWVATKAAMFAGFVTWLVFLVYFLCTVFWVGVVQIVLSIMGVTVYAKYCGIVEERKNKAENEAYWAERRKARGY